MKVSLFLLFTLLGTILLVEANPQRGGGGGRRGGGEGGLKGPFKACEDDVEVPECDDGQKARIYPNSECADLEDGDEFPEKKDLKDQNPCEGLEEDDEVDLVGCLVCAEGRRDPVVADAANGVDVSV